MTQEDGTNVYEPYIKVISCFWHQTFAAEQKERRYIACCTIIVPSQMNKHKFDGILKWQWLVIKEIVKDIATSKRIYRNYFLSTVQIEICQ